MRKTFINTLVNLARKDKNIWLLTPDMGFSILEVFFKEFPERAINTGIAEQNAMAVAAGLALAGKKVYVYSIIPFVTMRCFEQVRDDVCYMNNNVKIIGVGAGFAYGSAGATHHATEDIAIMRALPNMQVYAPADCFEVEEIVKQTAANNNPTYIRLGNKSVVDLPRIPVNLGKARVLSEGKDTAVIFTGDIAEQALLLSEKLKQAGKTPYLISMPCLKPIDGEIIKMLAEKGADIYSLEEHNIYGGLASAVSECLARIDKKVKFTPIAVPDKFSHYVGNRSFIRQKMEIEFK